jgi:transcriptional regulator with GAF, ATPase, and Fis domain
LNQVKIKTVETLPNHRLRIEWENGQEHIIELAAKIRRVPSLAPLLDEELFAQAYVGEWGWSVAWNDEIELDGAQLYREGEETAQRAFARDAFAAWMQRHGFSYAAAAKVLGLSQRTVANYTMGHRPIPLIVGLACRGYDAALADNRAQPEPVGSGVV